MGKVIADISEEDEGRIVAKVLELDATLRKLANCLSDRTVAYRKMSAKNNVS